MTAPDGLDRRLIHWLQDEAPTHAPDALLGEVRARAARTRRRPAWATTERWISMETRARFGAIPRGVAMLAIATTLLLLATAIALAGSALVLPPHIVLPPNWGHNGLIAYSDLGDIWLVDEQGEERQQLTLGPDIDIVGAWSPNGAWLAYWSITYPGDPHDQGAWSRAARIGGNVAIKIIRPDDPAPRVLVSGLSWSASGETGISWSPNSAAIAFDHRGSAGTEEVDIVGLDEQPPARLVLNAVTPAWSPDGQTMLYVTNHYPTDPDGEPGGGFGIMSIPVNGGESKPLSRASGDDASFFWPRWSNDSQRILFDAGGDIYIAHADGSGETAALTTPEAERFPRWSLADDRIAFLRTIPGDGARLVLTDADGGNEVVFDQTRTYDRFAAWSPDGSRLLAIAQDGQGHPTGLALLDVADPARGLTVPVGDIEGFGAPAWQRLP